MKALERSAHWLFAVVMTVVSMIAALVLLSLVGLKLAGLPVGTKSDPNFHYDGDPDLFNIYVIGSVIVCIAISIVVGIMSAPYAHRRAAAIIIPIAVFLGFHFSSILHPDKFRFGVSLLPDIATCAIVGSFFYIRSRRRRPEGSQTPPPSI